MAGSEFTAVPREMDPEDRDRLAGQLISDLTAHKERDQRSGGSGLRAGETPDGDQTALIINRLDGKRQELDGLFAQVLSGSLARGRPLKSWEPDRLDERHLQMIMLRSAGMDQGRIAQLTGFTESWVSIVLNHPDAQVVLARIIGYAADGILDINARIQATASEALDTAIHVMRTTADESLASKNAFELLKMAGYGAVERKQVQHQFGLSDEGAKELAQAMREAQGLQQLNYAEFVQAHPAIGSGSVSSGSPATSADSGQSSVSVPPTDGSQPTASPTEAPL